LLGDELVVPTVPAGREPVLVAAPPHGDHVLDRRALQERVVGVRLERDDLTPAPRAVGGDQDLGLRVVDPVTQRLRAEPTEHDRMRGPDPGAREHRDRELGDHAKVDVDPVTLADPQ
jgi:hypothetical protein